MELEDFNPRIKRGHRIFSRILTLLASGVILTPVLLIWATYINETVTTGSAYGFTIGSSREQVYETVQSKLEAGELVTRHTSDYGGAGGIWLGERWDDFAQLEDIRLDQFRQWKYWELWRKVTPNPNPLLSPLKSVVDFSFEGERVFQLTLRSYDKPVGPEDNRSHSITKDVVKIPLQDRRVVVRSGQTYEEIYQTLMTLPQQDSEFWVRGRYHRSLRNWSDEEFTIAREWSVWSLSYEENPPLDGHNKIRLEFENDQLKEINRWRRYF